MEIFYEKYGSVTHNYIWAHKTMLSFRKKPIPRKLMDGRKHGQTLFYRTLPAEARGPITKGLFRVL